MSYFVGCSTFVRLVAAASYLARRPERNCNDRNVSNRCRSVPALLSIACSLQVTNSYHADSEGLPVRVTLQK